MIWNATNWLVFPESIDSDSFPRARVSPSGEHKKWANFRKYW